MKELIQRIITRLSLSTIVIGTIGLMLGLMIGALVSVPLGRLPSFWSSYLPTVFTTISTLISTGLFLSKRHLIAKRAGGLLEVLGQLSKSAAQLTKLTRLAKKSQRAKRVGNRVGGRISWVADRPLILDTSAIIDGRIADIIRTGFLEGSLVLPSCVLEELQRVADSKNTLKRNRGRRGLEILEDLKKEENLPFKILTCSVDSSDKLDTTLLKFAKKMKAKMITTDYNLNKVARVMNVPILNVNELANMVKTVVLPGESLMVEIVQRGKENGQGVAYLPDGTMVVVENGEKLIGKKVQTVVERLFQTEAGRMIFVRSTNNSDLLE